ncbi:Hpt domain-containing protein [Aliiglaciecola sp. CAU 1673]|uniref:Hpt domain-containing protein n=1 Tax=Aliiglaciecola sp. CAU 1673 TaxID=3032595 RepID=UPI0023DAF920|nr:Hpt domain-containing protein [Aliiglaciecola sp. CAU 1673]MDF2178032.1 Hpt domain-containing protein [Aliiglaciecola sp. CAU 1673]
MSQAPLLDISNALLQLGGNQDLLQRLHQRFLEDYADTAIQTQTYLDKGEWHEAQQLVHSIKGVSGNLGLQRLYLTSVTLDTLLKVQDPGAQPLCKEFGDILQQTLNVLANQETEKTAQQAVKATPMAKQALLNALSDREFITADSLQGYLAGIKAEDAVKQQIAGLVDNLEYDAAIDLLSALPE